MKKNDITIKELPVDERPREKLFRYGVKTLSNSELLAILLSTGDKENSALMLAGKVLILSKGIGNLADLIPEELLKIPGIGNAKACKILAAVEIGKRMAADRAELRPEVRHSDDVATLLMSSMRYLKKEHFKVICLNTKGEIIHIEDISIGNLNSSIVHPREVFRDAVKRGANSIIVAHNHPSGNPNPSKNDYDVTRRLVEAGYLLGVAVLDHLIIGDGIYISLRDTQDENNPLFK